MEYTFPPLMLIKMFPSFGSVKHLAAFGTWLSEGNNESVFRIFKGVCTAGARSNSAQWRSSVPPLFPV